MLKPLFSLYRDAFSGLSRDVWLLSLVGMINRAGTMVFPFLTLYFVNHNGFTRSQAGFLLLAFDPVRWLAPMRAVYSVVALARFGF